MGGTHEVVREGMGGAASLIFAYHGESEGQTSGNVPSHCDAKGTGGLNQVLLGPLTRGLFDAGAFRTQGSEGAQCGVALGPRPLPGSQRDSGTCLCPQRKCTWLWVGPGERSHTGSMGRDENKQSGETHQITFSATGC